MGIETIEFSGRSYPKFQSSGYASRFIIPIAREVCKGVGFDIGSGQREWSFPGSIVADPMIVPDCSGGYSATNLPIVDGGIDYIFSSHCLEHLSNWISVLDYWITKIRPGGVLFLYLPDSSQGYWAFGNRKHVNIFTPEIIKGYMVNRGLKNIFVSGVDLNNSFAAMCEVP